MTAPRDWFAILMRLGVKRATAARWAPVFAEVIKPGTFSQNDSELDDFLGQILHESQHLERLEESLYYKTPGRLMAIWPSRFKSLADEKPYRENPKGLAGKVYGGRMGNVNPGDGWKYRGRGLIQVTGRDNYAALELLLRLDLLSTPDLLLHPAVALRASIAWWEGNVPDAIMGNVARVSKAVNGGTVGLAERVALTDKAREVMG